jgi:sporulation protein YlmC with PRC-barrel domain
VSKRGFRKEDLVGIDVIDHQGIRLGAVSDVEFTLDGKLFLIIDLEGEEKSIPFNAIKAIGDIVLLKPKSVEKQERKSREEEVKR